MFGPHTEQTTLVLVVGFDWVSRLPFRLEMSRGRDRKFNFGQSHTTKWRRQNTTAGALSVPQPVATCCYWEAKTIISEHD